MSRIVARFTVFALILLSLHASAAAELSVTTSSLPNATKGAAYSQTLATNNEGTSPYTWSIVQGYVPAGLSLNASTGAITGTPYALGTCAFTVKVVDSASTPASATKELSITVVPAALTITTDQEMAPARTNTPYCQYLARSGGVGPYTWSKTSGSFPAGVSLDASKGKIYGTPTAVPSPNPITFTIQVADSQSPPATASKSLSIFVGYDPYDTLMLTTSSLPAAKFGVAYSEQCTACGGRVNLISPYTWSVSSGSLPPGLSLSSGSIIGTPTATAASFTLMVKDKLYDGDQQTATKTLSISVGTVPSDLSITTESLPGASYADSYNQTLQTSGGVALYAWSIESGDLPVGILLNAATGVISGTPTQTGTSNLTVKVADSQNPADTDFKALSITVTVADLTVSTDSLPHATTGSPYSQSLSALGGIPPKTWSVLSGSLPPGIDTDISDGIIHGTPTAVGTYDFTVQVTDSQDPADTATRSLSICTVDPLVITTASLPGGTGGTDYTPTTLTASGGAPPLSWEIDEEDHLPDNLTLDSVTGVISGKPLEDGTFSFTVRVTDAFETEATKELSVEITEGDVDYLIVTHSALRSAFEELARHRRSRNGFTTHFLLADMSNWQTFKPTDDVKWPSTAPSDQQEWIRRWIIHYKTKHDLKFVVLGGDSCTSSNPALFERVPARYLWWGPVSWNEVDPHSDQYLPADLYYSALFKHDAAGNILNADTPYSYTWDSNQDHNYGDIVGGDELYVYPDVAVGRISAQRADDAAAYITKLKNFENNPAAGVGNKMLMVGAKLKNENVYVRDANNNVIAPNPIVADEDPAVDDEDMWPYHAENNGKLCDAEYWGRRLFLLNSWPYYKAVKHAGGFTTLPYEWLYATWDSRNSVDPNLDATKVALRLQKNWRYVFVNTHGHTSGWALEDGLFQASDLLSQTQNGFPIVYTVACFTAHFDTEGTGDCPCGESHYVDCFAERLLWPYTTNPDASRTYYTDRGAIAYIGSAREGVGPGEDEFGNFLEDGGYSFRHAEKFFGDVFSSTDSYLGTAYGRHKYAMAQTNDLTGTNNLTRWVQYTLNLLGDPAIYVAPPLAVAEPASLPSANANTLYEHDIDVVGGVLPYSWTIAWDVPGNDQPSGFSFDQATGAITWTPTEAQIRTWTFTVTVTDSASPQACQGTVSKQLSIVVRAENPVDIVTASLPGGEVGQEYSQTLAAQGGQQPYTWSIVAGSGSLPAGLSLNASTGGITGTPTTTGTSEFMVGVTDSQTTPAVDSRTFSIQVVAHVEITTQSLPNAQLGVAYSQTFAATGGIAPYSWSCTSLPAWLTFYPGEARIGGTPSSPGTWNFTVEVADSYDPVATDSEQFSVTVSVADLVITTVTPMPQARKDAPYWQYLTATGGIPQYTWSIISGSLPTGLSLNASAGRISGTSTAALGSVWSFTIRVSDAQNPADTASKALSITVVGALLGEISITTPSLPAGRIGQGYYEQCTAAGGSLAYVWTKSGTLPPGLSLNSSSGVISGTPTTANSYPVTITVTDSQENSVSKSFTIQILNAILQIGTSSLPDAHVGASYSQTLQATGGQTPYTWSLYSGSLPDGLGLSSSGQITGSPTTLGTADFTVKVIDSQSPCDVATMALSIAVVPEDLVITTESLPEGRVATAYSQTLAAAGGIAPYTWTIDSGSLPSGLSLAGSTGAIEGSPQASGDYEFTVKVTDSQTPASTATRGLEIIVFADLVITSESLPNGLTGAAYSESLSASGGKTPYAWSLEGGSLPAGLSLGADGVISGTPTASGESFFIVRVTDSQTTPDTCDRQLSILVPEDLVISTTSLPDGLVGTAYSQALAAAGGSTPYAWSLASGSLPAGLLLSTDGIISGTPTVAGTAQFTVAVADSQQTPDTADKALSLTVGGLPTFEFAGNDAQAGPPGTTYQTRTTLQWSTTEADDWFIIGFAQLRGEFDVRMTVDSSTEAEMRWVSDGVWETVPFFCCKLATLSAGSHTVTIDYRDRLEYVGSYITRARIVAIRKADLQSYSVAEDTEISIPEETPAVASLTFTPSSQGQYLLIYSGEFHVYNYPGIFIKTTISLNDAVIDEGWMGWQLCDSEAYESWGGISIVTCQDSQQVVKMSTYHHEANTTETARRRRILAIRLTDSCFASAAYAVDDQVSTNPNQDVWATKLTKDWSSPVSRNWLFLSSTRLCEAGTIESRLRLNDTTDCATGLNWAPYPMGEKSLLCMDVRELSAGSSHVDIDHRPVYPATYYESQMAYSHFIALPLD